MMNGVLLRKAVLGVKVNCKSMAASCIRLALLLVIVGAVAPLRANANSLSVGGGTLNWNVSSSSSSCNQSATYTNYYFSSFSFTSSTGVVTSLSGSDNYYLWNGTCASGVPQGAYPSSTLSLTGAAFVITFTPLNGGSGSATYAALTAQTITFANPGAQIIGTPLTLSATASSGLAVSYASQTTSICTVSGSTATFVAAGTCTIQATQAGNSTYAAATAVSQSFTVNASMQSQTITFANPGTQTVGTPLTLSATATSGLVVSFASQTTSICTVSGTAATFVAVGNCNIQATQAGNSTYAAATAVSQSFAVNAASLQSQTITFSNPGTQTVGTPLTLSATASSGLTVSFASQTTSICTVSGTVATFIAAGNCTIQATQAGNSTYAAATAVSQSFTVQVAATPSIGNIPMFTNPSAPLTSTLTNSVITQASAGNVGIGTTNPASMLSVGPSSQFQVSSVGAVTAPSMTFTGANGGTQTTPWTGVLCGGDYAEDMRADQKKESYEPGDVLVLTSDDNSDVTKSVEPYSAMVAGIYATKPGVVGLRDAVAKSKDNVPMAMVGVVPTKVSAENGSIHKGDLLVTSSQRGYAMKGTDRNRMLGAVIGKAMGSLDSGTGVIEVLVTLQ